MKKRCIILCLMLVCLLVSGCNKQSESYVMKKLSNKIENSKGYHVKGNLVIYNNEESYKYDVDVAYEKEDKFRVSLKNTVNNHEQIILKNDDGVYVLTPSLNKSFKFQSDWPYNNSQIYLLQTIIKDVKMDKSKKFEINDNGYKITSTVNYTNNKTLTKQVVYIDKDYKINKVQTLNNENKVMMEIKFSNYDLKATYDSKYFTLKENMTASTSEKNITTSKLDDTIYPMYIPDNTKLSSQDKVSKENGERLIMTFSGEKSFMLIQETASSEMDITVIPVAGEPVLLVDSVAAFSQDSLTWYSNGIEYYLVSDTLNTEEMMEVAQSISTLPVGK